MSGGNIADPAVVAGERSTLAGRGEPSASVVVVAYNTPPGILGENLRALARQTTADFETILVDNSDRSDIGPIVGARSLLYLKLRKNYGLSLARNVGIDRSRGAIVIFLDDDAVPAPDFVAQHIRAHERQEIVGLRGRAAPRTRTIYNRLTTQYDLGEEALPYPVNLEGNSSFRREILLQMGGFREDLAGAGGYEGIELSYRIIQRLRDRSKLIYHPGPVIRHDFCGSFRKYVRKLARHARHRELLRRTHPELFAFLAGYPPPPARAKAPPSPLTAGRLWLIGRGASLLLRLDRMRHRHAR